MGVATGHRTALPLALILGAGLHHGAALRPTLLHAAAAPISCAAEHDARSRRDLLVTSHQRPLLPSRRDLLLTSISGVVAPPIAGAAMAVPGASAAWSQQRPLRVCVVGAGSISREFALYHFGAATGTVVASVVDLDKARAEQLATDVGSVQAGAQVQTRRGSQYSATASEVRGAPVPWHTSLNAGLDGCDLVYIGTPPNSHAQLACEALEAGKSVLLEKPLAATPADADAIVAAAERAAQRGQALGLDIGMRWNPALSVLKSS
jgi:hypothetical protein